jgi:circadian clock protein KaiC
VSQRVQIKKLPSGVVGLDEVLGGGLPEFSFNLIAGGPGCGKTTLAHQIMFANATPERPALYVTILGEPPLKMLRYQQQYEFFDAEMIPRAIRFLHMGGQVLEGGLDKVLATIIAEVDAANPGIVVIDSFRSALGQKTLDAGQLDLQNFVQRLGLHLTSCQATTFLVGEYLSNDYDTNPVFTVADGILWLTQTTYSSSVVRQLQVVKMRGQGQSPGLHTMRISDAGLRVYPRIPNPAPEPAASAASTTRHGERPRLSTGIAGLDQMMGGGVPVGHCLLVMGPSGSGKTSLSTQFVHEGAPRGEAGVVVVFEKRPHDYLRSAPPNLSLDPLVRRGQVRMLHLRPLDLSVDETMEEIRAAVVELGARRVVIDSLSGLELALAPTFRDDFRESLYRMVGALTVLGTTVLLTAEQTDGYDELRLSPHGVSFLADAIVLQRYVELDGRLQRFMTVVKMRGHAHSKELRLYEITADGLVVGEPLSGFRGLLTGSPTRTT